MAQPNQQKSLGKGTHERVGAALIEHDKSLRAMNTFGFDQLAERFAEATDEKQLRSLLATARSNDWPVFMLGGGSNIVLTQDLSGLVIRFCDQTISYSEPDRRGAVTVTAAAGVTWHELVVDTLTRGLAGLENLALIPGTVGAAPIQNIGAYGVELSERLTSVRAWHEPTQRWCVLNHAACEFAYRDSVFKREKGDWMITAITLELGPQHTLVTGYDSLEKELAKSGSKKSTAALDGREHQCATSPTLTARDVACAVIAVREARLPNPKVIGNAGSFFKNPVVSQEEAKRLLGHHPSLVHYPQEDGSVKLAAGWLIDQLGFRGHQQAGVGVHEKQALVLTHDGSSNGRALMALMERVQTAAQDRYGVVLEVEPVIV